MKITAIVAPSYPGIQPPTVNARDFDAVDEFVRVLGGAAGILIPVLEGTLADAPTEGYVIVFERAMLANTQATKRVFLVNADRGSVLKELEDFNLVGAIEKMRYFRWRTTQEPDTGGVFVLQALAEHVGGTFASGPFRSKNFGLLKASRFPDLPSLVVGYLEAHWQLEAARGTVREPA